MDCKRDLCSQECDFSDESGYEESSDECPCKKFIIKPEPEPLGFLMGSEVSMVGSICECEADVFVVVGLEVPPEAKCAFEAMRSIDKAFDKVITLFTHNSFPLPIIYSPTVYITPYHDVRVYHDAAVKAFDRVILAEFVNPLLYVPNCSGFCKGDLLTIFGALQSLYVPIQVREEYPLSTMRHIDMLYLLVKDCKATELCFDISTMEPGRYVFRDVAMADPERLTPIYLEDYIYELFKDGSILIEIICDPLFLRKEFPLFDAVNRAPFRAVKRHTGRIILLEYVPECLPHKTLLIVGKGVTMDTGGVTVKLTDMAGSSREKSGVACVIGFMKILALMKPPFLHVTSALPLVRNSIGEEAYVPDEKIKNRAGVRVRFNNTDSEGRITMSDPLTFLKEQLLAKSLPDPHMFTLGTMTRHARYVVGDSYAIILDNSVARRAQHDRHMQTVGSIYGEPFEISWLRKDEFDYNKGKVLGEDLVQSECCNHTITERQHHIPAAFLIQSTLLSEHDEGSCFPIRYSHIDMQGSAMNHPRIPASQPLFTLAKAHIAQVAQIP